MQEICNREVCTGCMACYNACPKSAINMYPNEEGFIHPVITQEKCINCGLCIKVCPVINITKLHQKSNLVYSGWSNDEEIRLRSSSGGAFSEIAKYVISSGGVVFGCMLNEKLKAIHTYIDNVDDLYKLQQSKYVQSYIGDSFRQAKKYLDEKKNVLFSGVPCQIAGLRNYLRREYSNLWTIDIICHGVPSPLLFEEYKSWQMSAGGFTKIHDIKFRDKRYSWNFFNMKIIGIGQGSQKKTYIGTYYRDPYIRGFLRDYFLRQSCHRCIYTRPERVSDFTIADWWGYKPMDKKDEGYMYKGVSMIIANTKKADSIMGRLNLTLKKQTFAAAIKANKSLVKPFEPSPQRKKFWNFYRTHSFEETLRTFMYPENVKITHKILDRHKNTDFLVRILQPLDLLIRVKNKFIKILLNLFR